MIRGKDEPTFRIQQHLALGTYSLIYETHSSDKTISPISQQSPCIWTVPTFVITNARAPGPIRSRKGTSTGGNDL
ncbi:unnamed protein product, partial [Nesidiocoris tenuis]